MIDNRISPLSKPLSMRITQAEIDRGLRQFLINVYNYMASGLALTGVVAYVAAEYGFYAALMNTRVGAITAGILFEFSH